MSKRTNKLYNILGQCDDLITDLEYIDDVDGILDSSKRLKFVIEEQIDPEFVEEMREQENYTIALRPECALFGLGCGGLGLGLLFIEIILLVQS